MKSQQQRGAVSRALIIGLAVVALLAGFWGGQIWNNGGAGSVSSGRVLVVPDGFPGTVLPGGKALPEFSLQDDHGKPFALANLKGKWTLLFFGYTHCPDVCPTTLGTLKNAWDRLSQSAAGVKDLQVVFVSVDPERDSVEHLREYVDYFDPAFTAVTGSQDALMTLSRSVGAIYAATRADDKGNYLVDHTAAIFVIDPQGRFSALLSPPHAADTIAAAVESLRSQ